MEKRDEKKQRNKGFRQVTVIVYGEVTYQGTVYKVTGEEETKHPS